MRAKMVKESLDSFKRDRSGYLRLSGSEDFRGFNTHKPLNFIDDKDLLDKLRKFEIVDEDDAISYKIEGDSAHTFPVEYWVEFMLDSMHQNGQNKIYGDENDIYPFIDRYGYIGWISKEIRDSDKDLQEAKRRLR